MPIHTRLHKPGQEARDEALANIQEAIAGCLEVRAEKGMPLTVETRQIEVVV